MKTVDILETIAACDLKVRRCRQPFKYMKVCEHSRSMSFLDFGQRSFIYDILSVKVLRFIYPSAGHVITGNLKIKNPDLQICNSVSKGQKYRFPSHIDFNRCREEIASTLNDFGNRLC